MKHSFFIAFALVFSPTIAEATVTTYTNSADFFAANPSVALIEDFEDAPSWSWNDVHLPNYTGPRGLITFIPIGGTWEPNVTIAQPFLTSFQTDLQPIGSYVITTNGNEDFIGTLNMPATALGFNIFLNDSPGTLSFFNGVDLLATLTFDSPLVPQNNRAFAGIFSTEGVTGFRWTATNGQWIDTGIDNIYAGPVQEAVHGVPEPSTWAMMLLGFGVIGLLIRRARFSRRVPMEPALS